MDDDLLADDGQFKDDGLDDLDIDEEAALLGLSDEEIEGDRSEPEELQYMDEEGNIVDMMGENNAELYEVANLQEDKLSPQADDDVLELDLDAELDAFTRENPDILPRESPVSKLYNERQCKDNLISISTRNEKTLTRSKEQRISPEMIDHERSKSEVSYKTTVGHSSRSEVGDSYPDELEYDEESEDENLADDHRERFKSERSNIITLTPGKRRSDIPDTLESVISVEETAKVQAFLENEQKRKMRFKGRNQMHMKNQSRNFSRAPQNFQNIRPQNMPPQQMQYPPVTTAPINQNTNSAVQPHKILVNPHFRGVRMPPPVTEPAHTANDVPPVPLPPPIYENPQNFPPPSYSHHEAVHPSTIGPPVFSAPPHTVQYKHPEYPPSQHAQQQPPMPVWQPPPEMPQHMYANPPPVTHYSDPVPQMPPGYHNFNQNNFQNNNFQSPPLQQQLNYSQPLPPVHLPSTTYSSVPPINQMPCTSTYSQFPANQQTYSSTNQPYQELSSSQHQPLVHAQRSKFAQNQRFPRQTEKRTSTLNVKSVPLKQPRLDHPQRKTNVHVNPNIREIPLVDTLPKMKAPAQKIPVKKPTPVVEEEDEKTKELRMKIEEQKLLREQFLKRKEERRREMAAQRLIELKKRQAEQNKTITSIPLKPIQNNQQKPSTVQTAAQPKISVKNRIGLPAARTLPTKKKIIIVRKKVQQNANSFANEAKANVAAKQIPVSTLKTAQNVPPLQKINTNNTIRKQAQLPKKVVLQTVVNSNKDETLCTVKKDNQQNKVSAVSSAIKVETAKSGNSVKEKKQINFSPATKKPIRGMRPGPQRQPFHPPMNSQLQRMPPPRFSNPRGPPYNPRFMEPRMQFPNRNTRMNDMHLPLPPFQEHHPQFQDSRPPLLPFMPPANHRPFNHFPHPDDRFDHKNPNFHMRSPDFQNFQHAEMDMFHERFPPPQFQGHVPRMHPMYEGNRGPMFHKPRFQNTNFRQRNPPSKQAQNQQNEKKNQSENNVTKKQQAETTSSTQNVNNNQNPKEDKKITQVQQQKKPLSEVSDVTNTQVSVENLSSSTTEVQLKKLCSSVGVVQNIQLLKTERKAIIKFKESTQAINFQKKYQRYMLDLAMIQVSLLST